MVPKFLIDECLSPDLAALARERGFFESSHVTWLGKAGWKDWELKQFILEQDWTFVTRNSTDFRGPSNQPGSKGQYADVPIHAGLVCINGPDSMSAKTRRSSSASSWTNLVRMRWSIRRLRSPCRTQTPALNLCAMPCPEPDGDVPDL